MRRERVVRVCALFEGNAGVAKLLLDLYLCLYRFPKVTDAVACSIRASRDLRLLKSE